MSCPFEVLGLGPKANLELVKARFRELVQTQHPDHGGDPVQFQTTREAYARAVEEIAQRKCEICDGTRKVRVANGFSTIYVTCPECQLK